MEIWNAILLRPEFCCSFENFIFNYVIFRLQAETQFDKIQRVAFVAECDWYLLICQSIDIHLITLFEYTNSVFS